ncbi:hypothetical protein KCU83_g6987, partial [Aureobasidium melanogenum]
MAGALFTEAIGLLGTGLGIIQFGMDHLAPGQADPKGTIVGIEAGAGKGTSNTPLDQKPRFVRFIAHYAQERDTAAAVNSTLPKNGDWLDHFCEIFRGSFLEDCFISEVQDSLIDCLLDWIRKRKHDGHLTRDTLRSIINAAEHVDVECAFAELLKAFPHGDSTIISKDPLAEDFDQYCVYHIHGEDEPCYRIQMG